MKGKGLSLLLSIYCSLLTLSLVAGKPSYDCPSSGDVYLSDTEDRCVFYRCVAGDLNAAQKCAPGTMVPPSFKGTRNPCRLYSSRCLTPRKSNVLDKQTNFNSNDKHKKSHTTGSKQPALTGDNNQHRLDDPSQAAGPKVKGKPEGRWWSNQQRPVPVPAPRPSWSNSWAPAPARPWANPAPRPWSAPSPAPAPAPWAAPAHKPWAAATPKPWAAATTVKPTVGIPGVTTAVPTTTSTAATTTTTGATTTTTTASSSVATTQSTTAPTSTTTAATTVGAPVTDLIAILGRTANNPMPGFLSVRSDHGIMGGREVSRTNVISMSLGVCLSVCLGDPTCLALDYSDHSDRCWIHRRDTYCNVIMPLKGVMHFKRAPCLDVGFNSVAMIQTGLVPTQSMHLCVGCSLTQCLRTCVVSLGVGTCLGVDYNTFSQTCRWHSQRGVCGKSTLASGFSHFRLVDCSADFAPAPAPEAGPTTPVISNTNQNAETQGTPQVGGVRVLGPGCVGSFCGNRLFRSSVRQSNRWHSSK